MTRGKFTQICAAAFAFLMGSLTLTAQQKRVLFIGNSYTAVNNLPQMVKDVAGSTGDLIVVDSNTPGGYTFQMHANNTTTMSKIAAGNWDFVVLQEQSQYPAFPQNQVNNSVYPFAAQLNNAILQASPCAETVFYMTWGRKNGDASNCQFWPPVCTYQGMDDLIYQRYMAMADQNDAIVSPVGAVWKYLHQNHPAIELYNADESHPSVAGTYAAACTFYATLLRTDPSQISFDGTLSPAIADVIKNAAKTVAYNALSDWFVGTYDPVSDFGFQINDMTVAFNANAQNAQTYLWDFGDGTTSDLSQPQHTYTQTGHYTVTLTVTNCGQTNTASHTVDVASLGVTENQLNSEFVCYPTVVAGKTQIQTKHAIRQVQLTDMAGRVASLPFTTEANTTSVDLSAFSSAVYILKVVTDAKDFTTKIVKQ